MKKLIIIALALSLFSFIKLQAQQLVSSGGGDYNGENVSISWSIGEPVIETLSNGPVVLTQGFHQSFTSSNSILDLAGPSLSLKIYPNPTADDLNLLTKSENFSTMKFFLHNMEGKEISQGLVKSDLTKIEMYRYPHGIYLLRIVKKSGEPVQSFRVVKQ